MKKILSILALFVSVHLSAQVTVVLQPHFTNGIEGTLYYIDSTSPYWSDNGNQYVMDSTYYTYPDFMYCSTISNYDTTHIRHVIRFKDLSDPTIIPHGALIIYAKLHLYGVPNSEYGNFGNSFYLGSPLEAYGPNPGWVYELDDSFNAHTVNWHNAPGVKHTDSAGIAVSTAQWGQDDSIEVTDMVADMVAHVNTGFMTRLQNEVYGNERLFGSCFYSDSTKHPSLTIKYFPPTGVSDPNAEKVVYIYPNPAKNLLSARLAGFDNIPVTVSIYDLLGNVVYKQVFANGVDHLSIPVQQMTSGIYIFEALSERAEIRQKFIKE